MMDNRLRIVMCVLLATLVLGLAGCAGKSEEKIISGGYVPNEISNIEGGGDFDASTLTPHESAELSIEKLEGFWVYEGLVEGSGSGESTESDSFVVTDKVITLNEERIECLPQSIDLRPYSPMKALFNQGFGYGSASFEDAKSESKGQEGDLVAMLEAIDYDFDMWTMPYTGNGFVCAINGNTLALGFLDANSEVDIFGAFTDKEDNAINECSLTEVDYEVSLEGNRLTLNYGNVSASYIYREKGNLGDGLIHKSYWMGEPLYENNKSLWLLGSSPKDLSEKGFKFDCNLDEQLASCIVSEVFTVKTPGGVSLSAKAINPYEKSVPIGYSAICWYEYEGGKTNNLTLGMHSTNDGGFSFGVTPYSDVYNKYELPYEASRDSLSYKAGYAHIITSMTSLWDKPDTGNTVLESEHSCDIRLSFDDNVLSSVAVSDPVYLNGGLQDNVSHDDLDNLKPSVYREVAVQRDEILDELKKAFKAAGLDVAINEKTGEVVMDNSVLFATDSYELGDAGKAYLDKVFTAYASVILNEKYSSALKEVSFEGNTDSDGDSEYNMRLSENRANAVMEYCSGLLDDKQKATFDELAVCRGYGESDLVYDENGNEDKDASRRVAIKFMLNVDSLKSESGSQAANGSSSSASTSSSSSAASGSSSDSNSAQTNSDELSKYRSVSSKFNQAWSFYEESQGDGTTHVVVLLLSKDHDYCGYFDLKVDAASTGSGSYTFGETSVEENQNSEAITVSHQGDADKLDVIFNAWGKDDTVSVKDPWKGVYDLTALDDVEYAVSLFEDILSS